MNEEFLDSIEDMLEEMQKAEIIGEAAKRVPEVIRKKYPEIPWKAMSGMRDRIIHAYDSVDLEIVWKVVINDIPSIKPQLHKMLAELKG